MKNVSWCRCGYSGGDHPRTAQCSEGRRTISVPADWPPEVIATAIKNALDYELEKGAAGFADNGRDAA